MLTKQILDELASKKNTQAALFEHADPLQVASVYIKMSMCPCSVLYLLMAMQSL